MIPQPAADVITQVCRSENFSLTELAAQGLRAGTLSIPLVKALTDKLRAVDPTAAKFVHWGATSQDVFDTAVMIVLSRAGKILSTDHRRLQTALRTLSNEHANTPMLGRTLLQPAPPITFGLKIAGWVGAFHRSWKHLELAFEEARVLQFGGASGTLAALFEHGAAVSDALAENSACGIRPHPGTLIAIGRQPSCVLAGFIRDV